MAAHRLAAVVPIGLSGSIETWDLDGWANSDRERLMARRSNTQILIHS